MIILISFSKVRDLKEAQQTLNFYLEELNYRRFQHTAVGEIYISMTDIMVRFVPATEQYIKGTKPSYYVTDKPEVVDYYEKCGLSDNQRLGNMSDVAKLIFSELIDRKEIALLLKEGK